MSAVNREAIKKAIVSNLDPGTVPEGLHTFGHSVELLVTGSARRDPDTEVKPTMSLPVLEILAMAVAEVGLDAPRLLELIRKAVADAEVEDKPVSDYLERTKESMRLVKDELIAKLPLKPKVGAFTGAVDVELVRVRKA